MQYKYFRVMAFVKLSESKIRGVAGLNTLCRIWDFFFFVFVFFLHFVLFFNLSRVYYGILCKVITWKRPCNKKEHYCSLENRYSYEKNEYWMKSKKWRYWFSFKIIFLTPIIVTNTDSVSTITVKGVGALKEAIWCQIHRTSSRPFGKKHVFNFFFFYFLRS